MPGVTGRRKYETLSGYDRYTVVGLPVDLALPDEFAIITTAVSLATSPADVLELKERALNQFTDHLQDVGYEWTDWTDDAGMRMERRFKKVRGTTEPKKLEMWMFDEVGNPPDWITAKCNELDPPRGCSVCGKPCDDAYGYGPDVHCSLKCHDEAMFAMARDRMSPEEKEAMG